MTIEWLAGNRIRGTSAEKPVFGLPSGSVGGWVELGRHVLGSTASEVFVDSLPDKRYYMVLYEDKGEATAQARLLRYNSDSGSNYSNRVSTNGASDTTNTSQTQHNGWNANNTLPQFNVWYIANLAGKEKLLLSQGVYQGTAGAGTAPARTEYAGKWANTSDAINRIGVIQNAGVHGVGTTITVLGWDPADTHTTNFWEELGSDTGDGASDDLTVSGITAKKYLWIQFYADPDASWTPRMRFNSDTGSNYCDRYNINGGTDATDVNITGAYPGFGGPLPQFYNIFMINNSANEKLGINHNNYANTAGAGTAPERGEVVMKWANTSAQITTIAIDALSGTPNLSTSSYLKVWGSD